MTLQQLKYILKIVECRSITEAAGCSFSTQHYAFAVNAFVNFVKKAEAGIIYLNSFHRAVIEKLLRESRLSFEPLLRAFAAAYSQPLLTP